MTMLYRNPCYSEGSYNEVDLYVSTKIVGWAEESSAAAKLKLMKAKENVNDLTWNLCVVYYACLYR